MLALIAPWTPISATKVLVYLVCVLCQGSCGRIGFALDDGIDDGGVDDAFGAKAVSFSRLCEFDSHVIIENGIALDDNVGRQLSEAVERGCGSTITRREASQNDVSTVDADTGRPLVAGTELVMLGGGEGPHRVVRYLLEMDTPLIWVGTTITERATGQVIAQGLIAGADYILLQVVEEPIGGTLSLSGQGLHEDGTEAAVWYFEQVIVPRIRDESTSWYVVLWTDTDGTLGPSNDDTFTIVESG